MPLPLRLARNVKEAILQRLSRGNGPPMTSSELARHTGHRPETIARALARLRAESKVVSRRLGRHVLHRASSPPSYTNSAGTFEKADNRTVDVTEGARNGDTLFAKGLLDFGPCAGSTSAVPVFKQHFPQPRIAKWNPSTPAILTPDDIVGAALPPADSKLMARTNRVPAGVHVNDQPGDVQSLLTIDKLKV